MHSTLVIESIVVFCLELFQLTTPPFKLKTYPNWDYLSLIFD